MALAQTPPTFTEYPLGGAGGSDITTGPDGALWFVGGSNPGAIGRITALNSRGEG